VILLHDLETHDGFHAERQHVRHLEADVMGTGASIGSRRVLRSLEVKITDAGRFEPVYQ